MRYKIRNLQYPGARRIRYDIISGLFIWAVVTWFYLPILESGLAVVEILDLPGDSRFYLRDLFGMWNQADRLATVENLPRLIFSLIPWLISAFSGYSGVVFAKSFVLFSVILAATSMFAFTRNLADDYTIADNEPDLYRVFAHSGGALFYAANPFVLGHIDNPFFICGYALVPLFLLFVRKTFSLPVGFAKTGKDFKRIVRFSSSSLWSMFGIAITFSGMAVAPSLLFVALVIATLYFIVRLISTLIAYSSFRLQGFAFVLAYHFTRLILTVLFIALSSFYWLVPYVGLSALSNAPRAAVPGPVFEPVHPVMQAFMSVFLIDCENSICRPGELGILFFASGAVILILSLFTLFRRIRRNIMLWIFTAALPVGFFLLIASGPQQFFGAFIARLGRVFAADDISYFCGGRAAIFGMSALLYATLTSLGLRALLLAKGRWERGFRIPVRIVIMCGFLFVGWLFTHTCRELHVVDRYRLDPVAESLEAEHTAGIETLVNEDGSALEHPVVLPPETPTGAYEIQDYYKAFLFDRLNRGTTRNLGALLSVMPSRQLIFTRPTGSTQDIEYYDRLFELQRGVSIDRKNQTASLYSFEDYSVSPRPVSMIVHSPNGFDTRESLVTLTGLGAGRASFIYSHLRPGASIDEIRSGDFIEATSFDDFWLSNLPHTYYLTVADAATGINPHLGWTGQNILDPAWRDFLVEHGIASPPFEFDLGLGLAATVAPMSLYARPGETASHGRTIIDIDSLERLGLSFASTHRSSRIELDRVFEYDDFERAFLAPYNGEEKPDVSMGISGFIEIEEAVPYHLYIVVSGTGMGSGGLRFSYYDESYNDIGFAYVAGPATPVDSDRVVLEGDFVTPRNAAFIRIELLGTGVPSRTVRWWIHDLDIRELELFSEPNEITVEYATDQTEPVVLYARLLESPIGGEVEFDIGDVTFTINTRTGSQRGFRWVKIGSFKPDGPITPVRIRAVSGLQAVNVCAPIPASAMDKITFPARRAIESAHLFFSLEAENDFDYVGHLQSSRTYPDLSNGRGVSSHAGTLSRYVEILESGTYLFILRAGGSRDRSAITTRMTNLETGEVVERAASLAAALPPAPTRPVVSVSADGRASQKRTVEPHIGVLPDLQSTFLDPVELTAGRYLLEITLESHVANLSTIYGIRGFDPSTLPVSSVSYSLDGAECSPCESVQTSMMTRAITGGELTMKYEPSCSCDWYIVSSPRIGVEAREEYLLRFDIRSELLRERQVRLLFIDELANVVGISDIPESDEFPPTEWAAFEHIVEVPERANRMLFQIWGRGDRMREATMQLRNLSILPYKELPLLDVLYAFEADAMPFLASFRGDMGEVTMEMNPDGMKGLVTADEVGLIDSGLTPSSLWMVSTPDYIKPFDTVLNGVTAGVFAPNTTFEIKIRYRAAYYAGLILYLLNIVIVLLLQWFLTTNPEFRRRFYALFAIRRYFKKR